MKLELRHLAPYLPYNLQISQHREDIDLIWQSELVSLSSDQLKVLSRAFPYIENLAYYEAKPLLYPLSGLIKDKEFISLIDEELICGAWKFDNDSEIIRIITTENESFIFSMSDEIAAECNYIFYEWFISKHYDIFGLIKEGLAIDINTL